MSGAAGGSRINKEDLKATIRDYRDNILKPLGLDVSYSITGVRSRPEKNVFGDIDVVVSFPEGDKKELKQQLANFLTQNDRIPIIPSKNKKYFIHGNIVSILYPIAGKDGEYVQIDNIVTVSKEEGKFVYKMLDLPAQEQTLAIGLAKTIFTELDEKQIENLFKELGITNVEKPGEGEEYDFNLNPSELTLRIVPIGKNDGKLIWKSNKFEDVKKLTSALGIDIEKDKFDDIVPKIKKFKNRRSIDRLKGMFAKNIRVGDAEKEIEKGIKKQQALDTIASLEEKYNPLVVDLIKSIITEEETKETIAVFPGKFKPPHKDHIARIKAAANDADKVIVLVSPKTEPSGTTKKDKEKLIDQMPISIEDSLKIFKLANLPSNVKVIQSPIPSPVRAAYEMFENNPQQQFIAIFGKEEDLERFGKIPSNVVIKNYNDAAGDLSATDLRKALKINSDISQFMPSNITPEKYKETLGINNINENCGCQHSQQPTDFKSALASLTKYMLNQDYNIEPLPKLKIVNNDIKNAENILGKTAYYDPTNCSITLYTLNRHPKDVLRSYAHEMIHRIQDNEGRLKNINTTNTNEDGDLEELEKEAYLKGNMTFRNWEDSIKNPINEWIVDIPKFNYPKTIYENLWYTLNEITLNPNNAIEIYGDLSKGKFQIGDDVYVYDIKQVKNPYDDEGRFFNIMFHPKDDTIDIPTGTSNKENYIKILNTIYKIILDFAKEVEPEYIGISSMDNNRSKNYHRIYANLTDNKYNRIPGYFRKDVSLEFNTPKGKGRFIVLKRKDV